MFFDLLKMLLVCSVVALAIEAASFFAIKSKKDIAESATPQFFFGGNAQKKILILF